VNKNRLLIAVVVLAVLAGALLSRQRARESATSVEKPTVTLPKIKRDEITKVELENPDKKLKVTLERAAKKEGDKDALWNVSAPLAAKADGAAVDAILDKLSDLQVASVAATRKENHERLAVDAAHGVHVKAYAGDKLLLDAYVGNSKSGGTMLRKEGDDVVVATKGAIRYAFEKELKFLRDRTVTDVDPATIKALTLSSAKGTFKFEKPEGGNWQQAKGEKAIKDFAPSKVDSLASTFAKLHAVDFNDPAESAESAGLNAPLASLVLTPKEGAELKYEIGKLDAGASEYVLRASANPLVFRITRFTGDRLIADATSFSEPPPKPGEGGGGKGTPVAGGGDLPPEILKQLQQQGMMGGAHPPH
jgi:Domain of unknown function (DUF4340)